MTKEVLDSVYASLVVMLKELNELKATICVTMVYVEEQLKRVASE